MFWPARRDGMGWVLLSRANLPETFSYLHPLEANPRHFSQHTDEPDSWSDAGGQSRGAAASGEDDGKDSDGRGDLELPATASRARCHSTAQCEELGGFSRACVCTLCSVAVFPATFPRLWRTLTRRMSRPAAYGGMGLARESVFMELKDDSFQEKFEKVGARTHLAVGVSGATGSYSRTCC